MSRLFLKVHLSDRFSMPHSQSSCSAVSFLRHKILLANRLYHDSEADVYDIHHGEIFNVYAQFKLRRILAFCVKTLESSTNRKPLRVLDNACGTGNLTEKLVKYDVKIDAVDISPEMLTALRQKIDGTYGHKCRTFATDVDSFVQAAVINSYDLIAFSSALHHLPDYAETLRNTIRILSRPGILLIYHEPIDSDSIHIKPLSQKLRSLDRFVWKYWGKSIRRKGHSHTPITQVDSDLVDFHVRRGGIDSDRLIEIINAHQGKVIGYAATSENMRHWWSAWIDNFFGLRRDNFHLVALFK
ncbi:methyltransferase domain-containing protein [bacterium]|nr:methyltransferase domain-containing protein [bacterium]